MKAQLNQRTYLASRICGNFFRRRVCPLWVAVLTLASAMPATAVPPVRILPLGDSITHGWTVAGGYRGPLYQLLTNAGYNVDFVGTVVENCVPGLPDCDHEGHPGWRIDQIDSITDPMLDRIDDPDIILLMIGTNDYGQQYDTVNAINRLETLIVRIANKRPYAKIVVANLLEHSQPYETQIQLTFNLAVPDVVNQQKSLGREVYFTDLHSAVPLSDLPDQIHPNLVGYTKMATNWFGAITNLISPSGSSNPPAISRAYGAPGWTNVMVVFSKPISAGSIAVTNFSLSGGLIVQGASLDSVGQRTVTLTTSLQQPSTTYTVTVNNVRDVTPNQTAIASNSTVAFKSMLPRGAANNVSEATNYALVYSLQIPLSPSYNPGVTYDIDLRAYYTNFSRVAYYLELQNGNGQFDYLWVSLDLFTNNVNQIGVPTWAGGAVFRRVVTNLHVFSSDTNIVGGTNIGGWMEFWPGNYGAENSASAPGASGSVFDWGDNYYGSGNYGSMQMANTNAGQMLFSFNRWGGYGGVADLNIGNGPSGYLDWTFTGSADYFTARTLQVFVLPNITTNAPALVRAVGQSGWTNVVLTFSKPLDDNATNIGNYSISGGLTVLGAILDSATRLQVTLTTTPQQRSTSYMVTVNGVTDHQNHASVASNSTAVFWPAALSGGFNNVSEAGNYTLVYSLSIPNYPNYSNSIAYDVDNRASATNFSRVAYYLELQTNGGPLNYLWVSMDAFTQDANKIGVPIAPSSAVFQQAVTNMNVFSDVAGIITGINLSGGQMEFWPSNYSAGNAFGVPNASGSAYDWGDTISATGNYGSMQVGNATASQMLFSFNRWGGFGGIADVGIGNGPGSTPDWTFANNAANYSVKTLQVFVLSQAQPFQLISAGAMGTEIQWQAVPGRYYSVWKKETLDSAPWIKIGEVIATNGIGRTVDPQAVGVSAFYRVSSP